MIGNSIPAPGVSIAKKSLSPVIIISTPATIADTKMGRSFLSQISG